MENSDTPVLDSGDNNSHIEIERESSDYEPEKHSKKSTKKGEAEVNLQAEANG
jgi:hypothetical protein